MAEATQVQLDALRLSLTNASGMVPLSTRFRSLFTLRSVSSPQAVEIIGQALTTPGCAGALLGHELAYVLGQMGRQEGLPFLERTLRDPKEHPMVRHEAAEAMGAISSPSSLAILREYLDDANVSVRETCELAIRKVEFDHSSSSSTSKQGTGFGSVDPAPGLPLSMHATEKGATAEVTGQEVEGMGKVLLDPGKSLFERYRAMFGLRNAAGAAGDEGVRVAAVDALANGFADGSALFRHEIAYVFGQLVHPASVPSLLKVLRNRSEDEMVRHEAAEALGSIATPEVLPALREFASPDEASAVVRESCEVALDMYEYETSATLHYATPLDALASAPQTVAAAA